MDRSLTKIIDEAIAQMPEVLELDAPRAEAWASDLISLATETTGSHEAAVRELVDRLGALPGVGAAVAAMAVRALTPDAHHGPITTAPEGAPEWVGALGTARCDAAWIFANRRGESAVFRFIDSHEAGHSIAVDLIPGERETTGEVMVGPPEIIELVQDPDSDVVATETDPVVLAGQVERALGSTSQPSGTLVMNGPLLAARLFGIVGRVPAIPVAVDPGDVPPLPPTDPEDDAWATGILMRSLRLDADFGTAGVPAPLEGAVSQAADWLRRAAEDDAPVAQWLAASSGPVDLDKPDLNVVVAALATAVRPHAMAPLDRDAREAVSHLEWADWLGAVIGLVREGVGAPTDPSHLVDLVNRCPEVASTIPKADRPRVEWAFAVCSDHWDDLGVASSNRLTELGAWMLPRLLLEAWAPSH